MDHQPFDSKMITRILPHRKPFLFVDCHIRLQPQGHNYNPVLLVLPTWFFSKAIFRGNP